MYTHKFRASSQQDINPGRGIQWKSKDRLGPVTSNFHVSSLYDKTRHTGALYVVTYNKSQESNPSVIRSHSPEFRVLCWGISDRNPTWESDPQTRKTAEICLCVAATVTIGLFPKQKGKRICKHFKKFYQHRKSM